MIKKLLFLLLFISTNVLADLPYQPRFTWTGPTEFTDGTPLVPSTDLEAFRVLCSGASAVDFILPSDLTSYTAPVGQFTAGDYTCTMRSVANAANGGAESSDSNPVNFTLDQKSPNPIVDFGVN